MCTCVCIKGSLAALFAAAISGFPVRAVHLQIPGLCVYIYGLYISVFFFCKFTSLDVNVTRCQQSLLTCHHSAQAVWESCRHRIQFCGEVGKWPEPATLPLQENRSHINISFFHCLRVWLGKIRQAQSRSTLEGLLQVHKGFFCLRSLVVQSPGERFFP